MALMAERPNKVPVGLGNETSEFDTSILKTAGRKEIASDASTNRNKSEDSTTATNSEEVKEDPSPV